ncbi:dihydrodipicolinate synthase family protein [Nocardia nova]|uniref:dihydrodipicolinate synthase family protein n=1 Tax=Nocardia nova TaxID=37330 RepID=UPI0015E331DF|nr:dihydrodipicolinate synthase family protein [Nocardia nova]MBV7701576.1 dihydrodipicolinate synthase family protein [Nocardia nova]
MAGAGGVDRIGEWPIVAALTPFRVDGAVDYGALGDYLDLLTAAGVPSVLVGGTTGEFASLTVHERKQVLQFCRGRWSRQLIAQVGASAVGDVTELVVHANDVADALAVIAPYFFAGPPEAGVEAFYARVLRFARKPLLLYNFPRHTQVALAPVLVERLAVRFPLVRGIKDSGKDFAVSREYKTRCPQLTVLLGDDRACARLGELGVDGVVTGAGGPVAELPVAIAAATRAGDSACARRSQAVFDRYTDRRKATPVSDIAFAKSALAARLPGFPTHVRPPLTAAPPELTADITAFLRNEIFTEFG